MAIRRLVGIYNADGGIVGELRYVIGHILGTAECALCDITHSPLRRKPEWDSMVARLGIPFSVLHRNELTEELEMALVDVELPCVVAELDTGDVVEIMSPKALGECGGSVEAFSTLLITRLQAG